MVKASLLRAHVAALAGCSDSIPAIGSLLEQLTAGCGPWSAAWHALGCLGSPMALCGSAAAPGGLMAVLSNTAGALETSPALGRSWVGLRVCLADTPAFALDLPAVHDW